MAMSNFLVSFKNIFWALTFFKNCGLKYIKISMDRHNKFDFSID